MFTEKINRVTKAYTTGKTTFCDLTFLTTSDVFVPWYETEKEVEHAVTYAPRNGKLLEVGTGCGAVIISILTQRPDLRAMASDISSKALKVAEKNFVDYGLNVAAIQSDLFENIEGQFDVIIANLPYLFDGQETSVDSKKQPLVTLYGGGADGLDLYKRFFLQFADHLPVGGYVVIEVQHFVQDQVEVLAKNSGLTRVLYENNFVLVFRK